MSNGQQYSYNEASDILNEIYKIKQSLQLGNGIAAIVVILCRCHSSKLNCVFIFAQYIILT